MSLTIEQIETAIREAKEAIPGRPVSRIRVRTSTYRWMKLVSEAEPRPPEPAPKPGEWVTPFAMLHGIPLLIDDALDVNYRIKFDGPLAREKVADE